MYVCVNFQEATIYNKKVTWEEALLFDPPLYVWMYQFYDPSDHKDRSTTINILINTNINRNLCIAFFSLPNIPILKGCRLLKFLDISHNFISGKIQIISYHKAKKKTKLLVCSFIKKKKKKLRVG